MIYFYFACEELCQHLQIKTGVEQETEKMPSFNFAL